jgi:hypothetical protein
LSIELARRDTTLSTVFLEKAILETLAYSDIFDYPLRIEELHRYLPLPVLRSELTEILNYRNDLIKMLDGYYFLAGREHLIPLRQKREAASRPLFQRAIWYGRILASLPFIRLVGLTGSLALQNCDETADIDYLLVAAHGRVWITRAFALLLGRFTSLFGNTLCPNLIISDQVLAWQKRDLYSARELCQMIPISGTDVYKRLRQINSWTNSLLPNASSAPELGTKELADPSRFQSLFEWPLRGAFGDRIEVWEGDRKIKRFTNQTGYGPETQFDRNICQGNFDQHGLQTKAAFQRRLTSLGLSSKDK